MNAHEKINYLEIPSTNINKSKAFFSQVFHWEFQDYGPDYTAFMNQTMNGGFFKSDLSASTEKGSVLIVFYSENILETQHKVKSAGGTIIKPVFTFPGGCRFHFCEPSGSEFAVWSENNTAPK